MNKKNLKKTSSPFISVVIITRNRSKDLLQCLGSLIAQSLEIKELVIVDNASSDDTKERVYFFLKNTSLQIKYVEEKKIGQPYARNTGIRQASGDWIAYIDDDCVAD